jgi:hypothetical protein
VRAVRSRLAVTASVACLAALVSVPAARAAYTDPFAPITSSSPGGPLPTYALAEHDVPAAALAGLDSSLPNVTLTSILDNDGGHEHDMAACTSSQLEAAPITPAASAAWCFDAAAQDDGWSPQGLTTSGDFDGSDGEWGSGSSGYRVIAVAEHDSSDHIRVAWINYTDTGQPTYHWALLVQPNSSGTNFSYVTAHAGGMVWLGDSLWVTTTLTSAPHNAAAIDVFDFAHMYSVTDGDGSQLGLAGGTWYGGGYPYVMALSHTYTYNEPNGGGCETGTIATRAMCFSSMSVDKTTPGPGAPSGDYESLVTSEYIQDTGTGGDQALGQRDLRYPIGTNDLLATTSSGVAEPDEGYISQVANQQGILSHDGTWWVSHSSGTYHGQLWYQIPGQDGDSPTCPDPAGSRYCWSINPEALTYWPAFGEVWSVNEDPGSQMVFSIPYSSMPAPAGSTPPAAAPAIETDSTRCLTAYLTTVSRPCL